MPFPVPEWVSDCMVRGLPSLTIQYMSESATIELFRDCGDEGVKHMSCRGKQDIVYVQSELVCSTDQFNGESASNNLLGDSAVNKEKGDELVIGEEIVSDNTEENAIEELVKGINMEELMMGDQAAVSEVSASTTRREEATHPPPIVTRSRRETTNSLSTTQTPATTAASAAVYSGSKNEPKHSNPPTLLSHTNFTVFGANGTNTTSPAAASGTNWKTTRSSTLVPATSTAPSTLSAAPSAPPTTPNAAATDPPPTNSSIIPLVGNISQIIHSPSSTALPIPSTAFPTAIAVNATTHATTTTTYSSYHDNIGVEIGKTSMLRPHAPKFGGDISFAAPSKLAIEDSLSAPPVHEASLQKISFNSTTAAAVAAQVNATESLTPKASGAPTTVSSQNGTAPSEMIPMPEKRGESKHHKTTNKHNPHDSHNPHPEERKNEQHADFSGAELDPQLHRANRHRTHTKPGTRTYLQKIFG